MVGRRLSLTPLLVHAFIVDKSSDSATRCTHRVASSGSSGGGGGDGVRGPRLGWCAVATSIIIINTIALQSVRFRLSALHRYFTCAHRRRRRLLLFYLHRRPSTYFSKAIKKSSCPVSKRKEQSPKAKKVHNNKLGAHIHVVQNNITQRPDSTRLDLT